jgi:RimJ/RimL family protein N-acetyltransferase
VTAQRLTIATPRVELRELGLDDMRSILRGEAGAAPPRGDYPPSGSLTGLRIRVERLERGEAAGPWFQIVLRADGRAVGDFNFHDPPDAAGEVVAGIDLVPGARGRGLGTEVLRAACLWALDRPGVRSVRAEIDRGNAASRRMAEKAGMRFTGMRGDDQQFLMP